jgi:tetratricopeptide (TPR) repeat protein
MPYAVFVAVSLMAAPAAVRPAPPAPAAQARAGAAQPSVENQGRAYDEFLLGRHLEDSGDIDGAIAAYKRAAQLDPDAADIPAELAGLYMRQNRAEEAIAAAQQALKIAPGNREAHRVLGSIYAALADMNRTARTGTEKSADYTAKAITHLEQALDGAAGEPDPNLEATLARLYLQTQAYDKAIPLLTRVTTAEPGWREGPILLAQAYAGAGRTDDAIGWLEQAAPDNPRLYSMLAEFYERGNRWGDAAGAYEKALAVMPNNTDLQTRYASALMNAGGRDAAVKARGVLQGLLAGHPDDTRVLYLMSQAQRRSGDLAGAESTARSVMRQNPRSPWGYYALAETLEERQQYQAVVDALAPAVADMRARGKEASDDLALLLPHVGFAWQQLGDTPKALDAFQQAHQLAPDDLAVTGYLLQAQIAAKKYDAAITLARQARADHPGNLRLATLEAQALRQSGKADEGIQVLEQSVHAHDDDPRAWIALAQLYSDADRGAKAVEVLRQAEAKFPSNPTIAFQLGAVYDKQKRFADAEAAFKQLLAKDPDNAPALNYLGYMLADRGERLDESVSLLKKALAIDPENGSYLDSLGWAYFKGNQLDLARQNLERAATQLPANSVIQDHYGEVLYKLGRYEDAIAAWTRALNGDGEEIDRKAIDRRIHEAKQKIDKR